MAVLLLVFGSVGGARAALNLQSDIYESQLETTSINVAITEGDEVVSNVMMLSSGDMVSRTGNPPDKTFKIGKVYDLPLSVTNNGSIDEYVRVTVYQYWVNLDENTVVSSTGWFDGSGTKDRSLDPGLIKLGFSDGWTKDTAASSTPERTVYYYPDILEPGQSVQFLQSVRVDSSIVKLVEVVNGKYVYSYNGKGFVLEIQADAVQTHNGDAARISSWGQKGT